MIYEFLLQFVSSVERPYFYLKDTEQKIFSGEFFHGLPYDYAITKRDLSGDELVDARTG